MPQYNERPSVANENLRCKAHNSLANRSYRDVAALVDMSFRVQNPQEHVRITFSSVVPGEKGKGKGKGGADDDE